MKIAAISLCLFLSRRSIRRHFPGQLKKIAPPADGCWEKFAVAKQ